MRKASRVDALDAGFYSQAVTIIGHPRMKNALDTCLLGIGLGKYDPLLYERLEKMVARDNAELHLWFQIGFWLFVELRRFESYPKSQWTGHSLVGKFEQAGIDQESARSLIAKMDSFCKNKDYINKNEHRAVVKLFGTHMDLNTLPAVAIVEDVRDLARERDEREAEAMANEEKERLRRPVQVTFHGDVLGTVNLGTIEGNIHSSIVALSREAGTRKVAETLQSLTDAIRHNDELASEPKMEALQTLETLGEQAKLPEDKRKPSTFKAALGYLPILLNSVESASKVWDTFGPALKEFFQVNF